jgi:transporter family-2 protein
VSRTAAIISTLAVGGLIALQPPANAEMSRHVGDLGAALISAAISVVILVVLLLLFSDPGKLSGITHFKPEYAIGGIGGAAVVAMTLIAVKPLGATGAISLLVLGQLVVAMIADRLGVLGLHVVGITPGRLIGVGLLTAGTVLVAR